MPRTVFRSLRLTSVIYIGIAMSIMGNMKIISSIKEIIVNSIDSNLAKTYPAMQEKTMHSAVTTAE
jgi:hypothetical protein